MSWMGYQKRFGSVGHGAGQDRSLKVKELISKNLLACGYLDCSV